MKARVFQRRRKIKIAQIANAAKAIARARRACAHGRFE
jgi:hypothetical protein